MSYPESKLGDVIDTYHGTQVPDPYRWLEDPDSEETKSWVKAQNTVTSSYLEAIPQRESINERITELWDYERFGRPHKKGNRYFYSHNDGLQNQSVLLVADSLGGEPRVLLDPNELSDDGTVSLAGWAVSEDGNYLAYGLAADGSDWREWKVLDVASGRELLDKIEWVKFSGVSWTKDGKGFYYSRYDKPKEGKQFTGTNYYQKLYYHELNTPQIDDRLVYERKDEKEWGFGAHVTEDGRYLIIQVWRGTERKSQIFYQDLQNPDSKVVELIAGFDSEYEFVGNDEGRFWIQTDLDAPNGRLIAIDTAQPERENWQEVIPEAKQVLRGISLTGERFFCTYLNDASSQIRMFDLEGKSLGTVDLPDIGSAGGFGGKRTDAETFYSFSGFSTPTTIYRYVIATGESTVYRQPEVDFDPEIYETKQVFYPSKDGTKIPMFIVHKKGIGLDGNRPTILYGYGGFNIPLTPHFSTVRTVWLEMGGVYVIANLRGGGEYGRPWHEAGMKEKKQNVFDDFIAAAEWLIENKYTSSEKLAIEGGSNGGLLVGAVMTQRPELFAACVPSVGVMDMLRFHEFTIGWAWVSEYGSSDDEEMFPILKAYSPLHNLTLGTTYPATMVSTADHDDRVVPAHSFKFAAALQAAHKGDVPVLIRIETSAGHGAGTPTTKLIEKSADRLAFLVKVLGVAPAVR